MDDDDLKAIKERLGKADAGEWHAELRIEDGRWVVYQSMAGATWRLAVMSTRSRFPEANAAFIANAKKDMAALIEEVEKLRGADKALHDLKEESAHYGAGRMALLKTWESHRRPEAMFGKYGWTEGDWASRELCELPEEVFALLEGGNRSPGTRLYKTRKEAEEALSQALEAFSRA